ncbi:hypothetical protein B7494_g3779 [Chlorociboria aeruginascens]|nr:hypothetical protein B7494_g3779 [Chlorociboria aeruginascens]
METSQHPDPTILPKTPNRGFAGNLDFIQVRALGPFHPIFLRDACTCSACIDPSSKQKKFQTTDIPPTIRSSNIHHLPNGDVEIRWENDIPSYGPDHISIIPLQFLQTYSSMRGIQTERFQDSKPRTWDANLIRREFQFVNYEEYMNRSWGLYRALNLLKTYGLMLIRGVPSTERAIENIAGRIGSIRDTFYGRTWDVKSVPEAKNVAYTAQHLGLHMDLLYMANPPGFQFLHCLRNSSQGGDSLFSDSFRTVEMLKPETYKNLVGLQVPYHYRNAGEHYYFSHAVIQPERAGYNQRNIAHVNYSPPFQAPHITAGAANQRHAFPDLYDSLREFASLVESKEHLYAYRLQQGECVVFNNRRVLHGRTGFDPTAGERWFKGTYVDTDVFMSRYRVLREKFGGPKNLPLAVAGDQFVNAIPKHGESKMGRYNAALEIDDEEEKRWV